MKKKLAFLSVGVLASLAVGISVGTSSTKSFANLFLGTKDVPQWRHYQAKEATHNSYGVKEYWTNCNGMTVTVDPEAGEYQEMGVPTDAEIKGIVDTYGESDERIIRENHHFDEISGECINPKSDNGIDHYLVDASVTMTELGDPAPEGFASLYNYKKTSSIMTLFTEKNIDDVEVISFYISVPSGEFVFAPDDNSIDSGEHCYEIHPSAGTGTAGTMIATNNGNGTWVITTEGFRLFHRGIGGVNSVTFNNRHTLRELFHASTGFTWGAKEVNISELHLKYTTICEEKEITQVAYADLRKLEAGTTAAPLGFSSMYKLSKFASNFDLKSIDNFSFYLHNDDKNNSIILKGNYSSAAGGIYGGKDEIIDAVKEGNTWTVSLRSGAKMFTLPSWDSISSYTVENATKFTDLFDLVTSAKNAEISEIVTRSSSAIRTNISELAFDIHVNGGADNGTTTLTEKGLGQKYFGKQYEFANHYNDMVNRRILSIFKDYNIDDLQYVEFEFFSVVGGDLVFTDDNGKYDSATTYSLHPSAGANNPGVIRAYNMGEGTWRVTSLYKTTLFRNVSTGSQVYEFTYNNRHTLNELFNNTRSWGATSINLGDIIVVR